MAAGYVSKYFVINDHIYYFDYLDSSGVYCAKQTTAGNGVLTFNHKYYFPHKNGTLLGTSDNGGIIWTNDGRGYLYGVKVDSEDNVTEVLFTNASNANAVTSRLTGSNIKNYWPVCIDISTGSEVPSATYTITYNANGGEGAPVNQTKAWGSSINLSSSTPTRTGYTFSGWLGSDGNTYQASSSYNTEANLTLTAQWTPKTYTVTYHGNGGKYNGSETWVDNVRGPAVYGKEYTTYSNDNFFVRFGYTFVGWKDQNGTDWTNDIDKPWVWSYDYDVTLYAQWKANEYTLTFNPNGGTVSETSRKVKCGDAYGDLPTPTRKGYKFIGWYTAASSGDRQYGTTKMGAADITLYAQWERTYAPIHINVDGVYRKGWCWINDSGTWKIGHPWINDNNTWKSGN